MKKQSSNQSGTKNQPSGSVMVLYENAAAREQAVVFCEQLVRQPGSVGRPVINWYSFAHLAVPAQGDEVIRAAVYADMLAFAVTAVGELPKEIKLWTEGWLTQRGVREGSLVGLILDETAQLSRAACLKETYLRHLAHRAGMDYLSHFPGQVLRAIPNSLDSFNERAGRISPLLDEILHTPFVPPSLPLK